MPTAVCMIREHPQYRREAFVAGLKRSGFAVSFTSHDPRPGDVLVIWNRYSQYEAYARKFEAVGAKVLVVENGWLGEGKRFAIARSQHNGAGTWHVGDEDRWSALDLALKPWRTDGDHILVLPQRGIGSASVRMPDAWAASVYSRLSQRTGRRIVVRAHPGKEPHPPLEPDFENCWAVVTWGSGAAIKAIVAGIPVFYELHNWIGGPAAVFGIDRLEEPFLGDRRPMLERLSWAQWSVPEISAGKPFKWLLT